MNKLKSILFPIILAIILVSGAQYVSAWVGPSSNPPNENVPAPINVGSVAQVKTGSLGVGGLAVFGDSIFSGDVRITDGTQGVNKVFTSDALGNGTWQALPANCLN
jgi:hypothetical protein